MLLTDETGSGTATLAYSAFGEPVGDAAALPTRYQFSGGHGYESGLLTLPAAPGTVPLTFQHLGARWYQPNTGRFLQRDPIGLAGGMNVYAYCMSSPEGAVDPRGLDRWIVWHGWPHKGVVVGPIEGKYKIVHFGPVGGWAVWKWFHTTRSGNSVTRNDRRIPAPSGSPPFAMSHISRSR